MYKICIYIRCSSCYQNWIYIIDGVVCEMSEIFDCFSDRAGGVRVHLAPVAGGRSVGASGEARAAFAAHARALAYDCELDAVLDSVIGNRKDCFISIRGQISNFFELRFHICTLQI